MSLIQKLSQGARRRTRSPEHDFHLRHRAYVIQPFMFHPVRPGETLKSILWQSRAVTDPLANPLMGWHLEYYFFYVQLQDCVSVGTEDTALAPLWDPTKSFSDAGSFGGQAARLEMCTSAEAVHASDVTYKAYQRVVEEYFREDGETWNNAWKMSGALAFARRNRKDAFESRGTSVAISDVTVNIADGLTVSELMDSFAQYAMMIDVGGGAVSTFEDYLASQNQGRYTDIKRAYRPELIRVVKEWSLPTNTVDPATGTPTSAVSWGISARADKDRYFREAGYIVGVTLARPKTLLSLNNDPAGYMVKGRHWLPVQYMHDANAGIVTPGLGGFDTRDLFDRGSQFINMVTTGSYKFNQGNWVSIDGTTSFAGVYPVEADINANVWKASANNNVRQDGKIQMNILTDLPPDMNLGVSESNDVVAAEEPTNFADLKELATEYLAKLQERKAGKDVKLPNVRAAVEKLLPTLGPSS